eukprot:TRINITY_DN684_c0_g1_i1.p1 TRINITY_DN684_c0_g1~~TRINITY_DN684_c0_g1_i1.p1  ORF type:complete len:178 (+),score=36.88 TRINITY_DN684_c0_g1_i1:34-567(+)
MDSMETFQARLKSIPKDAFVTDVAFKNSAFLLEFVPYVANFMRENGCNGFTSLGSGEAITEWLMESFFEGKVEAVELYWTPHAAVQSRIHFHIAAADVEATFLVPQTNALFVSYPVIDFAKYFEQYTGSCIVIIADHEFPLMDTIEAYMQGLGFRRQQNPDILGVGGLSGELFLFHR